LRSLAFAKGGKPHSAGGAMGVGSSVICARNSPSIDRPNSNDKQWQEWKQVDKEFTSDEYEKDLQQALLMSKLEAEEVKQVRKTAHFNVRNFLFYRLILVFPGTSQILLFT
jgi:hypothetical protein